MKNKFYIGVDVGGTKIAASIVQQNGKILSRAKVATEKNASPRDNIKTIIDIIRSLLDSHEVTSKNIIGIGVGVPGIVGPDHNTIFKTPNINLSGIKLGTELQKIFRAKTVVGNDVNLGLLGEQWLGAAHGIKDVVGLFPGTGIGGAIIINGRMIVGANGAAAELGHMIMQINGPACSCGNHGCLEAMASRWALERDIRSAIRRGQKTILTEYSGKDLKTIKSKTLKKALKKKDPLTTNVMRKVGATLGQACITLRHIFNPQMIVLGGGIIEACGDYLLPIIKKTSSADPFFSKIDKCPIMASKLGDDAVMLGGVALVKSNL